MNRGWKIAAVVAAAILIPGGTYAAITAYWLGKISCKFDWIKILSIDPKFISLEIILQVKNPSAVSIKIEGYDLGVSLDGFKVAQIKSKEVKVLKAGEVSYLSIPVKINHQEVFGAVKSGEFLANILLKSFDKINVSLEGRLLAEVLKVPVSTKVKLNYTVAEILKMKEESKAPSVK